MDKVFDGDMCSALITYSEESKAEIEKTLHSRESYINPDLTLTTSANVDVIQWVLRNMTGDYPTV